MHSVRFSPHADLGYSSPSRTTLSTGDLRCVACICAKEPCIPAGSRRGGNFTHRRRTVYREVDTTEGQSSCRTSTMSPGLVDNSNDSLSEHQSQEPLCAELKNPCDALHILERLAANDSTAQGKCHGSTAPDKGRPRLLEGTTSETESVLNSIGTTIAYQLLQRWVCTCLDNSECNLTTLATPTTTIPFVLLFQNMFLSRKIFGRLHAVNPSSLRPF